MRRPPGGVAAPNAMSARPVRRFGERPPPPLARAMPQDGACPGSVQESRTRDACWCGRPCDECARMRSLVANAAGGRLGCGRRPCGPIPAYGDGGVRSAIHTIRTSEANEAVIAPASRPRSHESSVAGLGPGVGHRRPPSPGLARQGAAVRGRVFHTPFGSPAVAPKGEIGVRPALPRFRGHRHRGRRAHGLRPQPLAAARVPADDARTHAPQ